MAFQTKTCVIARCDLCGNTRDHDGGQPHHDTEAEALRFVLGDPAELPDTWYQREDGQLVCWRRDPLHRQARESDDHYRPGPDAMVMSFSDDEDDAQMPLYDMPAGASEAAHDRRPHALTNALGTRVTDWLDTSAANGHSADARTAGRRHLNT